MKTISLPAFRYLGLALVACVSAAALALAFAGWQKFSAEIFLSAVENGLAWCL